MSMMQQVPQLHHMGAVPSVVAHVLQVALAYYGPAFDGWMFQKQLHSVEGVVMQALGSLCPAGAKAAAASAGRTDKGVTAAVASAGRTDKGVTAAAQVSCWRVATARPVLPICPHHEAEAQPGAGSPT